MSDVSRAVHAVVTRILEGDGKASRALRRAAFDDAEGKGPLGFFMPGFEAFDVGAKYLLSRGYR
jgi:hypothetical protein